MPELKIRRQLQKALSTLRLCTEAWAAFEKKCRGCLDRIENLSDQYQCCCQATVTSIQATFPDVKERLLYKIASEVEEELAVIQSEMKGLEESCSTLTKHSESVMHIYKSSKTTLDLPVITLRTELSPSMADMLEWLGDAERQLTQQFLAKKFLLEEVSLQRSESVETLIESWNAGDEQMLQNINEHLMYAANFLEQNLT